jgi:dienelactone hydrolase
MVNGSDGSILDMWAQGGKAAVERGYNVLIYDGPGQGAMLWLQHVPFRYDFEVAVTPVVDWVLKRSDVDPKRMAIQGISQGGYWVPRAVAFEKRFAAAIADPGVIDVGASWWGGLAPQVVAMLNGGMKAQFDSLMAARLPPAKAADLAFRARPFGFTSLFDTFIAAKQYTLAGVVDKITTPMFITNPDNEQFFPGQPKQLYDALPTAKKALAAFTVAEGADRHCEPGAPMLRSQRTFDWLDTQLGLR